MEEVDKTEKNYIDNFLLDISCLDELEHLYDKPNIFDVLRITNNEIRHSNVLAWLLDANQNHGLGNCFFLELIKPILRKKPEKYSTEKWMLADFSKQRVIREWHKETNKNGIIRKNSLDILIVFSPNKNDNTNDNTNDNGLILAIENKVDSSESDWQTERYHEAIRNSYPDSNYEKMLLFLSPDGTEPKDDFWEVITYNEIHEVLNNLIKKSISEDTNKILNDYIRILERDIMQNGEMNTLCNDIYRKHKNALDIIFKYKEDDSATLAEFIKTCLSELNKETDNDIEYDGNYDSGVTYIRFSSKNLDRILPDSTEKNTWRNCKRYLFEIKVRDFKTRQKCPIALVLTMNNYRDQKDAGNTDMVIETLEKNGKRGTQFCSLAIKQDIFSGCKSFSIEDVPGSVALPDFKKETKKFLSQYVAEVERKLNPVIQGQSSV